MDITQLVEEAELSAMAMSDETVIHQHISDGIARDERWKRELHLGSGGVGAVFLEKCISGQAVGQLRAVKELRPPRDSADADVDIFGELSELLIVSQPMYEAHFVKTLGWFQIESTTFVAMEYLADGDLDSHLMDKGPMPEEDAKLVIRQILRGLAYLHENNISHGHLKPANILIRSRPPGEWWVKIADVGISKRQGFTEAVGFIAPEFFGDPAAALADDLTIEAAAEKGDVWAAGETLHFLLTCEQAFDDVDALLEYAEGSVPFPQGKLQAVDVPLPCAKFVEELMSPRATSRPSPAQALTHAWARMPNMYASSFSKLSWTVRCRGRDPPSVVFSRDGARVLAVTRDRLMLIETVTGKLLHTHESVGRTFAAAAISPDDRFAMVLEDDGRLSRFNARTLKLIEERGPFGKMPEGQCFVAYSPDGQCVATAHTDNFVIWRLQSSTLPTAGVWHTGGFVVRSMHFTVNSRKVALALDTGIHLMPVEAGSNIFSYYGEEDNVIPYPAPGPVSAVSQDGVDFFHSDGNHIYLWRDSARCWRQQYSFSAPIESATFSSSGATVATITAKGGVALWRARSVREVGCLQFPVESVSSVAVSPPTGKFMAMGLRDQKGPKVEVREIFSYVEYAFDWLTK